MAKSTFSGLFFGDPKIRAILQDKLGILVGGLNPRDAQSGIRREARILPGDEQAIITPAQQQYWLEYSIVGENRSTKNYRIFTKTREGGLYVLATMNKAPLRYSEDMRRESTLISRDPPLSDRLFKKIWEMPIKSTGQDLYNIVSGYGPPEYIITLS